MEFTGAQLRDCAQRNLVARYYYIYAIDYDRGGEWMGQAVMCTRDKEFTIRGISDCLARGYDRTGFFEVDTGEQRAWTVQLTESSESATASPAGWQLQVPATPPATRCAFRAPVRRKCPARRPKPMRRQRRTKMVATLGPASSSRTVISRLFEAGADVFRINMSHTSHEKMRELVARSAPSKPNGTGRSESWSIFRDRSCGSATSKTTGQRSTPGKALFWTADPAPGNSTRVHLPHPEIFAAVKPGDAS